MRILGHFGAGGLLGEGQLLQGVCGQPRDRDAFGSGCDREQRGLVSPVETEDGRRHAHRSHMLVLAFPPREDLHGVLAGSVARGGEEIGSSY